MSAELTNEQVYTLYDIENWYYSANDQVYEISAKAGCGKTFLVRYFIDKIGLDYSEVAFIAFMGKAAMQLSRTGLPAQTIHSLIYQYEQVLDLDENGKIQIDSRGKVKKKFVFVKRDKLPKKLKLIVVDEAGCVNKQIAEDILSFNIPVIALGDLNQLPPVFGESYFLKHPNSILTKIMRQNENDPIVWLADRVLSGESLQYGIYGKSSVISKSDLNEYMMDNSDIIITCTNKLRYEINDLFREHIRPVRRLDLPNVGEKIICTKNNWSRSLDEIIYLTNGICGFIDYVDIESFNGKSIKIDFKPDFINKKFKNLKIDYNHLFESDKSENKAFSYGVDMFEFAYAITCHKSQGSQYGKVLYLDEAERYDKEYRKRIRYTAITRAYESVTIVL